MKKQKSENQRLWDEREKQAKKRAAEYREKHKFDRAQLRKLSSEVYDSLFAKQGGLCAICADPFAKRLLVDHEHDTNPLKIRGLLCTHCNSALGFARDDIKILSKMIEYLQRADSISYSEKEFKKYLV